MMLYTNNSISKMTVLISSMLLVTTASSQEICIPDDNFIENLLNSSHGSKLNLTMTNLTVNIIACEALEISNKTGWTGGRLILSDSPEYSSERGKLYEDTELLPTLQDKPNRIFMYHVNGKREGLLKFAIFITNSHLSENATLTLVRKGVAEPTKNYILAGQEAFYSWLNSDTNYIKTIIPPLDSVQLDSEYYQFDIQPEVLLHGIYDYEMTQNHKLTLCALDPEDNPHICLNLPLLPRDRHIRGTFPSSDKHLHIKHSLSTSRLKQFPLADGVSDEFISGVDATDGSVLINSGNYGVLYKMNFDIYSQSAQSDRNEIGYLVNPRGGIWAGAVGIIDEESLVEEAYLLPEVESGILRNNWEGALIGKFDTGKKPVVLWMPTGGSNLPIRIIGVEYIKNAQCTTYNPSFLVTILFIFVIYILSYK